MDSCVSNEIYLVLLPSLRSNGLLGAGDGRGSDVNRDVGTENGDEGLVEPVVENGEDAADGT